MRAGRNRALARQRPPKDKKFGTPASRRGDTATGVGMRVGIRFKLIGGFGTVLALLCFVGGVGLFGIRALSTAVEEICEQQLSSFYYAN